MTAIKFLNSLPVFVSSVGCGFSDLNTSHKEDAYKGTDTDDNRKIEPAQIL